MIICRKCFTKISIPLGWIPAPSNIRLIVIKENKYMIKFLKSLTTRHFHDFAEKAKHLVHTARVYTSISSQVEISVIGLQY